MCCLSDLHRDRARAKRSVLLFFLSFWNVPFWFEMYSVIIYMEMENHFKTRFITLLFVLKRLEWGILIIWHSQGEEQRSLIWDMALLKPVQPQQNGFFYWNSPSLPSGLTVLRGQRARASWQNEPALQCFDCLQSQSNRNVVLRPSPLNNSSWSFDSIHFLKYWRKESHGLRKPCSQKRRM